MLPNPSILSPSTPPAGALRINLVADVEGLCRAQPRHGLRAQNVLGFARTSPLTPLGKTGLSAGVFW